MQGLLLQRSISNYVIKQLWNTGTLIIYLYLSLSKCASYAGVKATSCIEEEEGNNS